MGWNDLPRDLVDLIVSKLFDEDRHNFSLACRSWNAVVRASLYRHTPCLMFNQRKRNLWKLCQHNNFFYMGFPELEDGTIHFSNHGWLLISRDDNETLFFYNPLNDHVIELPSPSDSDCAAYTTICFFHPPTSRDCFILGIATEIDVGYKTVEIGVLQHGKDEWENYTYRSHKFQVSLGPPILYNGFVYFLDVEGNVATFDIGEHGSLSAWRIFPKCLKKRWLRKNIKEQFLIKPKGEETIFAVFTIHGERKVKVFRLSEEYSWELVKDLGDKVFYVSNTSSLGYTTDMKSKSMKNKIFFPKLHDDTIVYYSLESHKYHSFEDDYSSSNSHGLKRLDFATWIMPRSTDPEFPEEPLAWCP